MFHSGGTIDNRAVLSVCGGQIIYRKSVLSTHFFCEPITDLKTKVYYKKYIPSSTISEESSQKAKYLERG